MRNRSDPAWLTIARSYIGEREIKGPHHNPHILKWWRDIGAPFKNDETPWCGAFVGGVLAEAGFRPVGGGAAAKNWLHYRGALLDAPAYGCIVVFHRPPNPASGHVGFCVGKRHNGDLMILGGNQSDAVNVKPFARSRVAGYIWPGIYPYPERFILPVLLASGKVSTNER